MTPLERLEAISADAATLAAEVGAHADPGERNRIELVRQRLRVALDALAAHRDRADEITDE